MPNKLILLIVLTSAASICGTIIWGKIEVINLNLNWALFLIFLTLVIPFCVMLWAIRDLLWPEE